MVIRPPRLSSTILRLPTVRDRQFGCHLMPHYIRITVCCAVCTRVSVHVPDPLFDLAWMKEGRGGGWYSCFLVSSLSNCVYWLAGLSTLPSRASQGPVLRAGLGVPRPCSVSVCSAHSPCCRSALLLEAIVRHRSELLAVLAPHDVLWDSRALPFRTRAGVILCWPQTKERPSAARQFSAPARRSLPL
jgi:hypothetical protein